MQHSNASEKKTGEEDAARDFPKLDHGPITSLSHLRKMAPIDIEFNELSYTVPCGRKGSKVILRNVSGQFKSGELTGILGPSGAGKSSLLNILASYSTSGVVGQVTINGQPREPSTFKKMSCYIMQEDRIQPRLTISEAMRFAADLKLGNVSQTAKLFTINEILTMLRLNDAKNTVTEQLSGGEKKRLSIALELLNNPPVIFLDEPTTGLDEIASTQCIDVLKQLARLGRTVICSLHTPNASTFAKIDHVYVVARGQCVYRNSVDGLVPFFRQIGLDCPIHYNPADFAIEVSAGEYGPEWRERMTNYVDAHQPLLPTVRSGKHAIELHTKLEKPSWFYQFETLLRRMTLQFYRNRSYLYLKIIVHIFLGFVLGGLFLGVGNDATKTLYAYGYCFSCTILFLYIPMLPVLLHFPFEVQIVKREHFNRWYDLSPYYAACNVLDIPLQVLLAVIYVSMTYVLTEQPLELFRYAIFITTCCLCAMISNDMAMCIATTMNVVNSMFIGPTITVPLMLFAVQGMGESEPISILRKITMHLSYLRYGLEALALSVFGYNREPIYCPPDQQYCPFRTSRYILQLMRIENTSYQWDILALALILVFTKAVAFYLLRQRLRPNKTFQALRLVVKLVKEQFVYH